MKQIIFILLILFIQLKSNAQVFGEIIERNIQSTALIKVGKGSGSGIIVQDTSAIYLITARHNIFDKVKDSLLLKSNTTIVEFYTEDFTNEKQNYLLFDNIKLQEDNKLKVSKDADICIFKFAEFEISKSNKAGIKYFNGVNRIGKSVFYQPFPLLKGKILKKEELHLGEEIFTVGFPSSLGLKKTPQFDYEKPLLKRCAVASLSNRYKTFVIDCHVYGGNSGGPVFLERKDFESYNINLVGIAVEYIPFLNETASKKDIAIQTSSYAVIVPIDFALELIEEMK